MNARGVKEGRFITLEGGEGVGKSTHTAWIAEWLRGRGREVVQTREPGGSPLAEALRDVFLRDWPEGIDAKTETLVLFAARAAHLRNTIGPALAAGHDVVCDRFIDASYAYQGAGRGVPASVIADLERWVLGDVQPDITFLLDLDPHQGLLRTARRGDENRFESEDMEFMLRVRNGYLQRARQAPARYVVIDAAQSPAQVRQLIAARLERLEDRT